MAHATLSFDGRARVGAGQVLHAGRDHRDIVGMQEVTEERARLTIDTAFDAHITIEARGLISDWNPQAERTFGWTRDEIIGRSVADIAPSSGGILEELDDASDAFGRRGDLRGLRSRRSSVHGHQRGLCGAGDDDRRAARQDRGGDDER